MTQKEKLMEIIIKMLPYMSEKDLAGIPFYSEASDNCKVCPMYGKCNDENGNPVEFREIGMTCNQRLLKYTEDKE